MNFKTNVGIFNITPKLVHGMGKMEELQILLNGEERKAGIWKLKPGKHKVKINHP